MRTFTTGDTTAIFHGVITYYSTGAMRYCRRSNLVVDITTLANAQVTFACVADDLSISYLADDNGRLQIDLTDWARTKPVYQSAADNVAFTITSGDDVISVTQMWIFEGVCPDELMLPDSELLPDLIHNYTPLAIVPPMAMYASEMFSGINLQFALFGYPSGSGDEIAYTLVGGTTGSVNVSSSMRYQPQPAAVPANVSRITVRFQGSNKFINPDLLTNCDDHCLLIWQGIEGVEKRAIFRVRNRKNAALERVNFMTFGQGYDSRSGAAMSMEAYIEGCTRYDYAYYADIVCSPYVLCLYSAEDKSLYLAGKTDSLGVEVTTKNLTMPNTDSGDKKQTFAVEFNYRHYGSV